jgi:hypothetical protein
MNKEFLHMQKLAGLITESQYKTKLKEAEIKELTPAEASKEIKDLVNDPKFQAEMENYWAQLQSKLSPEELEKFKQNIAGTVKETLNEDEYTDIFNLANSYAKKVSEEIQTESWGGDISTSTFRNSSDVSQTAKITGKIISGVGKVGASMIPAALVAASLGVGGWGLGLGAVMAASLIAGAALWWLGDKIQGKE